MRGFGIVLMIAGLSGMFGALMYDPTVEVDEKKEAEALGLPEPEALTAMPRRMYNLPRANEREMLTHASGAASMLGAILFGFVCVVNSPTAAGSDTRLCPNCAEYVKARARVCRHCSHDLVSISRPAGNRLPQTLTLEQAEEKEGRKMPPSRLVKSKQQA